jgi:hypothetical protein
MENQMQTTSEQKFFEVSPEFKKAATAILSQRPFAEVANQMAVLRKETNVYHIEEINIVVGYLGDLPYASVASFFDNVRGWVKEAEEPTQEQTEQKLAPVAQTEAETEA